VRILDAQCLFVSQEVPPEFPYKTKKPRKEQPVILTDFFAPFMATFRFMRCAFLSSHRFLLHSIIHEAIPSHFTPQQYS
jgi:hypothetical protein